MWWNFVGRSHEDVAAARTTWEAEHDTDTPDRRFGPVHGYDGPALPAPALPNARLKAKGRYNPHRCPPPGPDAAEKCPSLLRCTLVQI